MLKQSIIDVLEKNGWLIGNQFDENNVYYTELEGLSPAGENLTERIEYNGTGSDFVRVIAEHAYRFNVDAYVLFWANFRADVDVSYSIESLLQDGKAVQKKLFKLSIELDALLQADPLLDYYDTSAEKDG